MKLTLVRALVLVNLLGLAAYMAKSNFNASSRQVCIGCGALKFTTDRVLWRDVEVVADPAVPASFDTLTAGGRKAANVRAVIGDGPHEHAFRFCNGNGGSYGRCTLGSWSDASQGIAKALTYPPEVARALLAAYQAEDARRQADPNRGSARLSQITSLARAASGS